MFQCDEDKPGQCSAFFVCLFCFFLDGYFLKKKITESSLLIRPFDTPQQWQTKIQTDYAADLSSSQLFVCSELCQLVDLFWAPFKMSLVNRKAAELV